MKRILQKSLFRLRALLLLAVMFVVGGSAWADESVTFDFTGGTQFKEKEIYPVMMTCTQWTSGKANGLDFYGSSQTMTFEVEDAEITKVVFYGLTNYYGYSYNHSVSANSGGSWENGNNSDSPATWNAPAACASAEFSPEGSSDFWITKVDVYYKPVVKETIYYNVVITSEGDLPAGFTPSVTLNGQNFTENGQYPTTKTLNENHISVNNAPEDWYYEVDYDAENDHTFTVTYKEYNHYIVGVTGCDESGAGVKVNGNWTTYGDGDKINVKNVLTVGDLTVENVNGYVAGVPVVSALDGHNATIAVPYSEADIIPYTVTITGMPAGASVMIENEEFTESGVHESRKTLRSSDAHVRNCPATHYTNDSYSWYDSENHAFNIEFTPYLVYTVAVADASAYKESEAGVKVKYGNTYRVGDPIYVKSALTVENVDAAEVDGYTGTVTLAGNEFTVSYTKDDYMSFVAEKIPVSVDMIDETKDVINLKCWDAGSYFTVIDGENKMVLTSSAAPIIKVEFDYYWGLPSEGYNAIDRCNTGSLNSGYTEWTGTTNRLELWNSNGWGTDLRSIKVYLAQPIEYHVNITGMPASADAYAILNYDEENGKYTEDGNYTYVTTAELNYYSLYLNVPASHKVNKTYDAETKTYNVTYTALTRYDVVADAENAYTGAGAGLKVNIGGGDFRWPSFGDTFYVDGTLEESAIQVLTVAGYNGSFVLNNSAEPKTITVKYAEKENETYTVVFTGDVPEDASVTITDAAGSHVVNFTDDDKTFLSRYIYTEEDAVPAMFEFYDVDVNLDGTTFTVTYEKVNYIYVDLTTSERNGNKVTNKSAEETISASFTAWDGMAELASGWPLTITSSTYNIVGIEYVMQNGYVNPGMTFNAGRWTNNEYNVWEANGSKTKTVTLDVGNSGSDVYYSAVKVYLESPIAARISVDADGWTSLCINEDFIVPDDYTAYTAGYMNVNEVPTIVENGEIILTEISEVRAGTPVLIHGKGTAELALERPINTPAAPEVNFLLGNSSNDDRTWTAQEVLTMQSAESFRFGESKLYKFSYDNNGENLGFYWGAENGASLVCKPHKAFLVIPNAQSNNSNGFKIRFGEDESTTGIDAVDVDDAEAIYNLQGKRVARESLTSGVYVQNGKKFIVK